jgi:hypothetical protein
MSVQATTWVWSNSKTTGTAKLVMLAIADHAWQDGTNAWPSIGRLAKMTGLSEDTVRRAVKQAEELNELAVDRKNGGRAKKGEHASNDYVLLMTEQPPHDESVEPQPLQNATPNPRTTRPLTLAGSGGNHKGTVKETKPLSAKDNQADKVCRKWWDSCNPKPMPAGGFVGARKIIKKALDAGWSPEDLERALPNVETLAFWSLEKALKQNQLQTIIKVEKESWW